MITFVKYVAVVFFALASLCWDETVRDERVIHVSVNYNGVPSGDPGSATRPLRSINEAMQLAMNFKKSGVSTRVLVQPGVYREKIDFGWTNWKNNQPDNDETIVVEAVEPGSVVVSGADIISNWQNVGDGLYTSRWQHNWGVKENPWKQDRDVEDIVLRREMVFVNSEHLRQVLTKRALDEGTFFVDEAEDLLYVRSDVDLPNALVEVAVRDILWNQQHEWNVTLRGVNFEKAASPWKSATAAVRIIGSNNFRLEDSSISWNNGRGLVFIETVNAHVSRTTMNNNGWDGWGSWRVINLELIDTETSFNNWRGHLGGFHGWSVGNKLESTHGLVIRNHRSVGNFSRGLWLDYDMTDVLVEDVYIADNLGDGIWVEASQGPVTINHAVVCSNGGDGLKTTFAEKVTVSNSRFIDNQKYQLMLGGKGTRRVQDHVTKDRLHLRVQDWTVANTIFAGGRGVVGTTLPKGDWEIAVRSSSFSNNTFLHPNNRAFMLPRSAIRRFDWQRGIGFETWQAQSGLDSNSTFANRESNCSP